MKDIFPAMVLWVLGTLLYSSLGTVAVIGAVAILIVSGVIYFYETYL